MTGQLSIDVQRLVSIIGTAAAPLLLDVRKEPDFAAAGRVIAGSVRRAPDGLDRWLETLPNNPVVVYCAHGRSVSQGISEQLRAIGRDAMFLEGGYASWCAGNGPTVRWRSPLSDQPSCWVTRERPKIDRIACPWLIRRFIDPLACCLFVPAEQVLATAAQTGATPFDIPDTAFSHRGEKCSFDAFIEDFELQVPGLDELASIVRGADTNRLGLAPQSAGLLTLSLGLSANFRDDQQMLAQGLVLYDALFSGCSLARGEGHNWKPETMRNRTG